MSLRPDSLAQILSYSNAYPGCRACVFDSGGIVAASLIERLGGSGEVICCFAGQDPPHAEIIGKFNFGPREMNVLSYASAFEVFGEVEDGMADASEVEKVKIRDQGWPVPLMDHTIQHLTSDFDSDDQRRDFLVKRASRFIRKLCRPGRDDVMSRLRSLCDSLVIATKFDPLPILKGLLPFLAYSCPFVVFSEHIEPLAECFDYLKTEKVRDERGVRREEGGVYDARNGVSC